MSEIIPKQAQEAISCAFLVFFILAIIGIVILVKVIL
jgi:hypothetical protein